VTGSAPLNQDNAWRPIHTLRWLIAATAGTTDDARRIAGMSRAILESPPNFAGIVFDVPSKLTIHGVVGGRAGFL
jgi:phage gp29-like protein